MRTLVLMGATEDGRKELIAVSDGYRESTQSWRELLLEAGFREVEVYWEGTDEETGEGDGKFRVRRHANASD